MPLRRRLLSFPLLALAAFACAPHAPPHLKNIDRVCDTWCKERGMCSQGFDHEACKTECRARGDNRRPYWREDYVDAIAHCIEASTCAVLTSPNAQETCYGRTRPEPSETARRACAAAEARQRACKAPAESVDDCLNGWNWRVLGDQVLEEMLACEQQPCEQRAGCVNDALGSRVAHVSERADAH